MNIKSLKDKDDEKSGQEKSLSVKDPGKAGLSSENQMKSEEKLLEIQKNQKIFAGTHYS